MNDRLLSRLEVVENQLRAYSKVFSLLFLLFSCAEYSLVPRSMMWTHVLLELFVLLGACVWSLDTSFNLLPIYHLHVLYVEISYEERFCLQIYPAILVTMVMGFLTSKIVGVTSSCWAHNNMYRIRISSIVCHLLFTCIFKAKSVIWIPLWLIHYEAMCCQELINYSLL